MRARKRITLARFIERRLGPGGNVAALLREMLVRAFGAETFAGFWQYWNPVYSYYLHYYCYKPLRRLLPRSICVVLTFAASGFFLHDLPSGWWARALRSGGLPVPFVALWFAIMGILVLATERLKLSFAGRSFAARVAANSLLILSAFLGALQLVG